MTLATTAAPAAPRDARWSIPRWWGVLLDGASFGILAVLAWAVIVVVAHGSGAMHVAQSAATVAWQPPHSGS